MQESPVAATPALRESEKAALITLLGDEDPAVYEAVRSKLLSLGAAAQEWLRPHMFSRNRLVARRVSEIVQAIGREEAHQRFRRFCLTHADHFDMEEAAWLLAQTTDPEINVEAYQAVLDEFAAELRPRTALFRRGSQILSRVNDFLFREQNFSGHSESEDEPEHCYLNRVLDRRVGNAHTLCLVYIAVAKRLELPIAPVDLAGHFLCRYQTAAEEIYIDAFHHGRLLTRADCVHHLIRTQAEVKDNYLSPVSSRYWMQRLCEHLAGLYEAAEAPAEAARIREYLGLMSPRLFI
ncbi:MAG: transglutaminase-like domain-containing protein [Verrucomicrobiales bacterium]|nr:transglutaminase-like domain-containing protein [Verrucomicrobiales bacterium]